MKENGTLIKIDKQYATVRIGRNSACAECGKCGMAENQKHVDFFAENSIGAKVGDIVCVEISDNVNTAGLALVGYALPLLPALVALFVTIALGFEEWLSIVLFFVGYALGFAIVYLLDKRKNHKWGVTPTIVSIIKNNGETKNEQG